jgi:hypothetical protein
MIGIFGSSLPAALGRVDWQSNQTLEPRAKDSFSSADQTVAVSLVAMETNGTSMC